MLRVLIFLILLVIPASIYAQEEPQMISPHIYRGGEVSTPPKPGYDLDAYLDKRIKMPDVNKNMRLRKSLVVSFLVSDKGAISNVTLKRKTGFEELDDTMLKAISNMPDWQPAIRRDKPVYFHYEMYFDYQWEASPYQTTQFGGK